MAEKIRKEKPRHSFGHIVVTILIVVLCIVYIPILVLNTYLIVRGSIDASHPANVFGYTPVASDDILIFKECDFADLKEGDEVAFTKSGKELVGTVASVNDDGNLIVKIDGNNFEVSPGSFIGKLFYNMTGAGSALSFIQSTKGFLMFAGIPLVLFIILDVIRRRLLHKKEKIKKDQLPENVREFEENPDNVDLPREVLKKPHIEAQSDVSEYIDVTNQVEPAPERMAETNSFDINTKSNENNAEAPRCNEPTLPLKVKVKVGKAPKTRSGQKATAIKVKVSK